jgi:glycosyltransferase involved in cell wall biosynthesis
VEAASFVVAISSYGRGQLYRWVDAGQWRKVQVVHCALEADYFSSAPPAVASGPARLLCVGRLCEQKGQLLLIEAVRRLVAEGESVELILAGDGEMRAAAEEAIRSASLQQHVGITGWLSGDEVRAQLEQCTALALPSFAEGLPVVIMEAMALAKPVISTYVAGIPELVRPGENGWLVPAGDVDELVETIRALLRTSPERLAAMGRAGRQRCRERHSVDAEAVKLAGLFAQAAEPGRAALMVGGAHATLAQRKPRAPQ